MSFGPCLCGDPYCWSCGPAQGNYKCPYCGEWSLDGGCKNPEACAQAEKEWTQYEEEALRDQADYFKDLKEGED